MVHRKDGYKGQQRLRLAVLALASFLYTFVEFHIILSQLKWFIALITDKEKRIIAH